MLAPKLFRHINKKDTYVYTLYYGRALLFRHRSRR